MPVDAKLVREVFLGAVELPVAERATYLAAHCGDNTELQAAVQRLLAAHDQPASVLVRPGAGPFDRTATYIPGEQPDTVIDGRYKLVERIGEGGMGSVWLAHQSQPVKRKVAVKLIKAGMDSKAVLARFEAERQALAVMDHPNIAKVLDGGLHDGRPFLVMELVKGVPITEYCDARKLTPKERLELFVPVCQAIQHAHQKGIIHRDIKPSNVLIALYDDKPVPKVIDFGIAKATGSAFTEQTLETAFGGVVGTPQYMSPEQASLNNLDIDTRSDVYSLGVLLYELLTGSPPFAREDLQKAGLLEILRIVREEDPPRPSTKLSTADALPSLSATRGTEPKKLTGLLRNELDWIVMKALEKDRGRRYVTANDFAADVNRYLAGEVVEAHPPSTAYRVKTFIRRNRGQVLAASLVLFALLAGITGTTVGLIQANRAAETARLAKLDAEVQKTNALRYAEQEAAARKQSDAAREEEVKQKKIAQDKEAEANAVVAFFEKHVFAAGRPKGAGGLGYDVTLKDAIAASLPSLSTSFKDQPLVEARLRNVVGRTFWMLGEKAEAAEQHMQALALHQLHCGPDHPLTLSSMSRLYEIRGTPELFEELLATQRRVLPADDERIFTTMNNMANAYGHLGRHDDALRLREEAYAVQMRVLGPDHHKTLLAKGNLALSYYRQGRTAAALQMLDETLVVKRRVLPADHYDLIKCMNNVATLYTVLNRHEEALSLYLEALAACRRSLPPSHWLTRDTRDDLLECSMRSGRHAGILALLERELHVTGRQLEPDDQRALDGIRDLAKASNKGSRPTDDLILLQELLAFQKRVLPKDHSYTLGSMVTLASCLMRLDRDSEAITLIDEYLAMAASSHKSNQTVTRVAFRARRDYFQSIADPAGCRVTAEMWEQRNLTEADSLYRAACFRAVTAGVQAQTPGADAAKLAQDDADRAMEFLQRAVTAGYKDAAHLATDSDLDALREREDFKKLAAELEQPPEGM